MPSQKTGVEMPSTAAPISRWSRPLPGRAAARAPAPTPTTTETSVAARARRTVAGRRSATTSVTGRCWRYERPRSPRRRRPIHVAYCTTSGRSSAYSWRSCRRTSGSARCPSARRRCATGRINVTGAPSSPGEPDLAEGRQELGRRRQRRPLEAPDVRLDEGPARVVIEGDPHRVVEDQLLGLAVPREARDARRHRVGLVEEAVDRRIPVAGGVAGGADVARVEEHRQEVLGIRVVGDPALAEEAGRPVVDEHDMGRPVEAAELESDADLPELGLDELRDPLVQLGRVVVVRDAGQPEPPRE